MKYSYIAIEGCIGAGKTTFASRIAAELEGKLILEQFEDNPFLPKFYKNQEKYAFPLELSFLASRYQQLMDQLSSQELFHLFTVSDYFITKSLIFAQRTLHGDELALYSRLFQIVEANLPQPQLLVYLYSDIDRLLGNIRRRGRDYEQNISAEYLQRIQTGYFDYMRQQTQKRIVIIDTNSVDFVARESDYQRMKALLLDDWPIGISRVKV
ncbi:MAG: deoxynucleoside kinase [Bacteroidales bacterium]|nr:deoxynucleoside kinase [Bacteroidales bacterium]MDD2322639.1 deoxynucleoside kinase [Bacteroidales bacterium]MDD3962661.1 deoxynucleoside kinase [Bacteroidales bacterium]MDY0285866.1 deoxynucleoside kinase [Bacteroidales bacterium]HPE85728.1 deoxynucleoside kinase [Bacteroidales bacterium]